MPLKSFKTSDPLYHLGEVIPIELNYLLRFLGVRGRKEYFCLPTGGEVVPLSGPLAKYMLLYLCFGIAGGARNSFSWSATVPSFACSSASSLPG